MGGVRILILVWLFLLGLLGLTVAGSTFLAGPASLTASIVIALAKAALIYWFFMDMRKESGLLRLAAVGAGAWLAILLWFVTMDYLTRTSTGM
ncbi:MAG: cytochrome C oxidase subunit IV family protein [Alphaproteobacteria bacterium]